MSKRFSNHQNKEYIQLSDICSENESSCSIPNSVESISQRVNDTLSDSEDDNLHISSLNINSVKKVDNKSNKNKQDQSFKAFSANKLNKTSVLGAFMKSEKSLIIPDESCYSSFLLKFNFFIEFKVKFLKFK